MVQRYLPDADLCKFPASWSYTPADESLTPLWEAMSSSRPDATAELKTKFGSLFGALLHATKYRPEVMAPLGLLGSCLSFPSQELYDLHLLRVLIYLARTRSLGVTYSKHADHAATLRAFADSNWAVTRSTTGYTIMLAGASIGSVSRRQHCIAVSSCEAELYALAECAVARCSSPSACVPCVRSLRCVQSWAVCYRQSSTCVRPDPMGLVRARVRREPCAVCYRQSSTWVRSCGSCCH